MQASAWQVSVAARALGSVGRGSDEDNSPQRRFKLAASTPPTAIGHVVHRVASIGDASKRTFRDYGPVRAAVDVVAGRNCRLRT